MKIRTILYFAALLITACGVGSHSIQRLDGGDSKPLLELAGKPVEPDEPLELQASRFQFDLRAEETCDQAADAMGRMFKEHHEVDVVDSTGVGEAQSSKCDVTVYYYAEHRIWNELSAHHLVGRVTPSGGDISLPRFDTEAACLAGAQSIDAAIRRAGTSGFFRLGCGYFWEGARYYFLTFRGAPSRPKPLGVVHALPQFENPAYPSWFRTERMTMAREAVVATGGIPGYESPQTTEYFFDDLVYAFIDGSPAVELPAPGVRIRIADFQDAAACEAKIPDVRALLALVGSDSASARVDCAPGWPSRSHLQVMKWLPTTDFRTIESPSAYSTPETCEAARPAVEMVYRDSLNKDIAGSFCKLDYQDGAYRSYLVVLFDRY